MQQLYHLENLEIPCPFLTVPTEKIVKKHARVFTDTSEEANAAVFIL